MPNWDLGCVTSRVAVTSTHDKLGFGLRDVLGLGGCVRDIHSCPCWDLGWVT